MEDKYNVVNFPDDEPYFTDSQIMNINEMISDGLTFQEIIENIKKW